MSFDRQHEVVLRQALPRALATLTRICNSLDLAEDAAQEAAARAMAAWAGGSVPDNPVGWLVRTGRNWFIDQTRRARLERRDSAALALHLTQTASAAAPDTEADTRHCDDDLLRLIFVCCHPALPEPGRIALTLRTLAGLTTPEIARAFLVEPRTMEQRITRAKRKIADSGIGFGLPLREEMDERLDGVLTVVYLIFNEGYSATGATQLIRADLCREAIRLTRLLARLFPSQPEVHGLLSLLLSQHARAAARLDRRGDIVELTRQDRALWDQAMIAEAAALLERALRKHAPGRFQIQAAIAALHCGADSPDNTDWRQIAGLYAALQKFGDNPVVTVNRAVALGRACGPRAGLTALSGLSGNRQMRGYLPYHLAVAELCQMDSDPAGAKDALESALELANLPAQMRLIRKKLAALAAAPS